MPPVDWSTLLAAAPNIVTAVVFGFFVIKLLDRQDKQNDKRDDEWRAFLGEGRDQYTQSVSNVATQMTALAGTVHSAYSLLVNHDTWERSETALDRTERAAAIVAAAEAVKVAAQVAAVALEKSGHTASLVR